MNGLIEGNSPFLVKRRVEQLERVVRAQGWSPTHVQGAVQGAAEAAVAGNLFFGAKQVLFVWDPAKDIPGIKKVMDLTDDTLVLFLIHLGTAGDRKRLKRAFPLLKTETYSEETRPWKRPEWAAEWAVTYAKELGAELEPRLATALVSRVGDDLGFLRWEIFKANCLRSGNAIEPRHIKAAMAPISELQPTNILKAIENRNESAMLTAADRLRRSTGKAGSGLVMWTVSTLSPTVLLWAAALNLRQSGVPTSLMAQRLDISKWKLENVVLPACRMWSVPECARLLKALSDGEQGVFSGARDPWTLLVSRLACCLRVDG